VVRTFASHFADAATVRRYLHVARRLLPELHEPFQLDRVQVPTLAIWGRRDAMVPLAGSRRLLEAVAGSRLELMDTCGHCPQIEEPGRFTELVLDFASDLCSGAPTSARW
jgi:pimeloyl-ACP methyl ester carboxylesterase